VHPELDTGATGKCEKGVKEVNGKYSLSGGNREGFWILGKKKSEKKKSTDGGSTKEVPGKANWGQRAKRGRTHDEHDRPGRKGKGGDMDDHDHSKCGGTAKIVHLGKRGSLT